MYVFLYLIHPFLIDEIKVGLWCVPTDYLRVGRRDLAENKLRRLENGLEEQTENIRRRAAQFVWKSNQDKSYLHIKDEVVPLKNVRVILSKGGETEADSPKLKQKKINTQLPTYKIEICLPKYFINMDSSRMRPFNGIYDSIYVKCPVQANL